MPRLTVSILAALFFLVTSAAFLAPGLSPDGLLSPPTFFAGSLVREKPERPVPVAGVPTRPVWAFDHVTLLAPYAAFVQRELRSGRLPLWNPLIGTGLPVIEAVQPAFPHPFTLALLVLPSDQALSLLVLVRLSLAGLGGFLLIRTLGCGLPAAALGGLLFMLAPFHLSYRLHTLPNVSAMLPFLMLVSERVLRSGSLRRHAAAWSLLTTLAFLGGHSETVVHVLAAAWTYHLLNAAARAKGSRWRAVGSGLLFLLACTMLGAAGATVVLWGHSQAVLDSYLLSFRQFGAPLPGPADLSSFLVPTQNYAGTLALLLVARGLFARAAFPAWPWLTLGFLALLAVYQPGPIATVLEAIPIIGDGLHSRALFIVHLTIAVLAARGLSATSSVWTKRGVAITSLLLAVWLAGLWAGSGLPGPRGWFDFPMLLAGPWLFLGLGSMLLLLSPRWVSHRAWALCAVAVAFVELYAVHGAGPNEFPSSYPPLSSDLPFAGAGAGSGRVLVPNNLLRANVNMVYDFPVLSAYDATIGVRQMELLHAAGVRTGFGALAYARPEPRRKDLRILDLLSVGYIVTERPISDPALADRLELIATMPVAVYRNPHALPRAFIAEGAIIADGRREAARLLKNRDVDLRRVAILEGTAAPSSAGVELDVPLEAEIVEYHAGDVQITASSPRGGTLVFSETYLSGWRATVDGAAAPVLRADLSLIGVPLPAGVHEVRLRYRPVHLTAGAVISAVVVIALLVAVFVPIRKNPTETESRSSPEAV